jgi:hypothetical protein
MKNNGAAGRSADRLNRETGVSIAAELSERHLKALKVILLVCQELSVLPELLEIFGQDKLIKFLDIFCGQTVRVPSKHEIKMAIRDVDIWVTLTGKNDLAHMELLAERHTLTRQKVVEIFRRTGDKLRPYVNAGMV